MESYKRNFSVKNFKEKIKILKRAQKGGWALGQFNVSNLEAIRAVFQAAKKLKSPVIIGTSEGESSYIGLKQVVVLTRVFEGETGIPAILNLDHGKSLDYIKMAVDAGYDSVHFDGSNLPLTENIRITKKVVEYAHRKRVLVEGELGLIRGSSEILKKSPKIKKEDLTDPKEAEKFLKKTKVDFLAISVGTLHGMEIFKDSPHIDLERVREIKEKIRGEAFLVLHGGSGTPNEDIRGAIKRGIIKVNINTEMRLAFATALEKIFKGDFKEIAPYKYMPEAIGAIQKIVEEKIKLFESNNKL
ncbi:MAG: class II fructose-bisphosphate aldolase [Patescibacteria group bacterium]